MNKKHNIIKYLNSSSWNYNPYINIVSGILFKDNEIDECFLQLKLKMIFDEIVDSVSIKILCINKIQNKVSLCEEIGNYTFDNIVLDKNKFFGYDTAISLPSIDVYDVKIFLYNIKTNDGKEYDIISDVFDQAPILVDNILKMQEQKEIKKQNSKIKKIYNNIKFIIYKESFRKKFKKYSIISVSSILFFISLYYATFFILREYRYNIALDYYNNQDYEKSFNILSKLDSNYKNSLNIKESSNRMLNIINVKKRFDGVIGIGNSSVIGITKDKKALLYSSSGFLENQKINDDIFSWDNINYVAYGYNYAVAITDDGNVVLAGDNTSVKQDFSNWNNMKKIVSGGFHTVGLKSDGTVMATGVNYANQTNVYEWNNIIDISAGISHTVALKSDGTVVATGSNDYGQLDVDDWKDIVKVVAGRYHTVGLKSDGTVVATGLSSEYQTSVEDWKNIYDIAAGYGFTVGITKDGNIIHTYSFNYKFSLDTNEWNDLIMIYANSYNIIGIKSDGSIISKGKDMYDGYMSKVGWNNIGRE